MKRFFLQTQRPEDLESRSYPGQRPRLVKNLTTASQPMSHAGDGLAEKGKRELRAVQADRPAADSGRIGQPISVLELRQRLLPRTVLRKAQPQCLAARHQAVMRVRRREQRKESERRPATGATAALDPDPVVVLVVRLLAAAAVTNNRIAFTNRASA